MAFSFYCAKSLVLEVAEWNMAHIFLKSCNSFI